MALPWQFARKFCDRRTPLACHDLERCRALAYDADDDVAAARKSKLLNIAFVYQQPNTGAKE